MSGMLLLLALRDTPVLVPFPSPSPLMGLSSLTLFYVFQSFHHPLILDLDFLDKHDGIFSAENNTLYLKDPDENKAFSIDTNTGFARVYKTTNIPAHSVVSVQVFISNLG